MVFACCFNEASLGYRLPASDQIKRMRPSFGNEQPATRTLIPVAVDVVVMQSPTLGMAEGLMVGGPAGVAVGTGVGERGVAVVAALGAENTVEVAAGVGRGTKVGVPFGRLPGVK